MVGMVTAIGGRSTMPYRLVLLAQSVWSSLVLFAPRLVVLAMNKCQNLGLVSEYLAGVDRGVLRATCAMFTEKPPQTVEDELNALKAEKLLWMRRAIAMQEKARVLNGLYHKVNHHLNMRVSREREEMSEPDSDDDAITCNVCGRVGGGNGFAFHLADGGVMCEPCYDEEPNPAAIVSSF
jgi:hypothetical protein